MVALIFLLVIATVFAAVLALEGGDERLARRPVSLLTWIASGNWPAKIGGGLMIVGVGALLRYAAIHFEAPPVVKLGVGIGASVALGIACSLLADHPRRRAISLALGGSAFGVAYLTAYSAFALFGYLPTLQGLGLLALTAVGAGVFAVSRGALSLAVLSMVGAFMAPAFAVEDPGAQVVYGYYVAINVLTLLMVAIRGWRPLIHLSFLFTLAGGAFFEWTAGYFSRTDSAGMLPLVAMLVAVHVAMPLLERRWVRGRVVESLDTVYLLALPVAAALTAWVIAPTTVAFSLELWWFAAIWIAAALWLYSQKRAGSASHAVIGLLMAGLGLAARYRDLPWELVALGIAVASLALAARRSTSERLHGFLAGLVLVLAAVHMIGALAPSSSDALFLNDRFCERMVGAGLLLVAALTLRRLRHALDGLVLTVALGWSVFALGAEIARLELVSASLLLHWMLVAAGFASFLLARRWPGSDRYMVALTLAIGFSAVLAQFRTDATLAWVSALLAGTSLLAIALRFQHEDAPERAGPLLAAIGAPLVVAMWMARYTRLENYPYWHSQLAAAAGFALLVMLTARFAEKRSRKWFAPAVDIYAVAFAVVLAAATVFDIERSVDAVLLELICVAALVIAAAWNGHRVRLGNWIVPATVIGIALVLQANLLRWLGPSGDLDLLSVTRMNWPTLVSLLWASIGASLTIVARRVGSRMQWSAGAAFLVGAAVKLLLLDFGSLGDLANILAVIAAGGVFLLVGWLAPMPPGRKDEEPEPLPDAAAKRRSVPGDVAPAMKNSGSPPPREALELPPAYWQSRRDNTPERRDNSWNQFAWILAVTAIILMAVSQYHRSHAFTFGWQ
jgi:uncharacterized membrane protein